MIFPHLMTFLTECLIKTLITTYRLTVNLRVTSELVEPLQLNWTRLLTVTVLVCSVGIGALTSSAYADVSLDALNALDICDEEAFRDPVSPCYGLEDALGNKRKDIKTLVRRVPSDKDVNSVVCDGPETKTFTIGEGYLSDEIKLFTEYCGWTFVWKARRNNRVLDWRITVPYTIAFKSMKNGLERILEPYRGVVAADMYVDVKVIVVSINIDRT